MAYTGRHNCLWCEIDSADLMIPLSTRGPSKPRDLINLQANHQDFLDQCKHTLKCNLPGLHISLGIFDRLWELLENACNELDLAIIKDQHQATDGFGHGFGQYVKALDDVQQLRGKLNTLYQHAAYLPDATSP